MADDPVLDPTVPQVYDPASLDAFSRLGVDSSAESLQAAGYQRGVYRQQDFPPPISNLAGYQRGDLTEPDQAKLGELGQGLSQYLLDPGFMSRHPDLPDPTQGQYRDPQTGELPRNFNGDESIKSYAHKARKAYEEALGQAGVSAADLQVFGDAFEKKAELAARQYSLSAMARTHPGLGTAMDLLTGGMENVPFAGRGFTFGMEHIAKDSYDRIAKGEGDIGDYRLVAAAMARQSAEEQRGTLSKLLRGAARFGTASMEFSAFAGADPAKAATLMGGLGTATRFTAAMLPINVAMGLADDKPLSQIGKEQAGEAISNYLFTVMGGMGGASRLPPGVMAKAGDAIAGALKMLSASEISSDSNYALGASGHAGPLATLLAAKTPEEKQRAIQQIIQEGGAIGLFELFMKGAHSAPELANAWVSKTAHDTLQQRNGEAPFTATEGIKFADLLRKGRSYDQAKTEVLRGREPPAPEYTHPVVEGQEGGKETTVYGRPVKVAEAKETPKTLQEPSEAEKAPEVPIQEWSHTGTKFRQGEGGRTEVVGKDGKVYTVSGEAGKGSLSGEPYAKIHVHDPQGNEVGSVKFDKSEDPTKQTISATDARIQKEFQGKEKAPLRRGLVDAMYDFMHEEASQPGHDMSGRLVPSKDLSPGGKAIWSRNAALAEARISPEARQQARANDILKVHNESVADKNAVRRDAWRALKEHDVQPANYRRQYEDASKVPGLDEVAGKLAEDRPDLLRQPGQEPSDVLHDLLRGGMERPLTLAQAYQKAGEQLAGEFNPEERNGVKSAIQRAGLAPAAAEKHARSVEAEVAREAAAEEAREQAEGSAREPGPGESSPGAAPTEVAPGVSFRTEPGPGAPRLSGRLTSALHNFFGGEEGSVKLSPLWDDWLKRNEEPEKEGGEKIARLRAAQAGVAGKPIAQPAQEPKPGKPTLGQVEAQFTRAGNQAKAVRERLAELDQKDPITKTPADQPLSASDWRQRVVRLHADAYLKTLGEALREPSEANLARAGDVLIKLESMARSRGMDAREMIDKELPELGKLRKEAGSLFDHWLQHPEDLPHSEEVKNAIRQSSSVGQRLGHEPASIRRGIEQNLQSAEESTRSAAQGPGATQPGTPEGAGLPETGGTQAAPAAGDQGAPAPGGQAGGNKLGLALWDFAKGQEGSLNIKAVGKWFSDKFSDAKDKLAKEGGEVGDSLKVAFAPATRGEQAVKGAGVMRENLAVLARQKEIAQETLKAGQRYFDRHINGAPDEATRNQRFLDFADAFESGKTQNLPQEVQDFAKTMRELINDRAGKLQSRDLVQPYIENYMSHLWQRPGQQPGGPDIGAILSSRRPMAGKEGFRRERTLPTYRDGIEAGLQPVDWNPVGLVLKSLEQMDKSIMAHDVRQELGATGLRQFAGLGQSPPQGWVRGNDPADTVHQNAEQGLILRGHYYYPEPVARIINNHLQPGLRGNKAYDVVREVGNTMNQFQLGFGAFHAGFAVIDTQISAAALGLQEISRGDFLKGAGHLLGAPLAPIKALWQGSKVLREYYAPGSQGAEAAQVVQWLEEAGGRSRMDAFYKGDHLQRFRDAIQSIRQGKGGVGSALYNALPALSEALSKPVMEAMVPRMKLGVFADMARSEMERLGPMSDPSTRRAVLGKAWDSVENRLGQLTYDNLFWNRVVKDLAMVGVRSVGWNLGTVRELGGGVKDIPGSVKGVLQGKGISPRLAYLAALPLVHGFYGAMYQYLATGQWPQELKDYFFPRTGRTRPDGTPDRISLPSYMRDVAHLTNRAGEGPMRVGQNAWEMAKSKLHPFVGTVGEMLDNQDFYGAAIRNPDDSAVRQSLDTAKHMLKSFEPFSVRGFQQQKQQGAPLGQRLQSFVGMTPAPSYITHTAEQQRAAEMGRRVTLSPQQKRKKAMGQ